MQQWLIRMVAPPFRAARLADPDSNLPTGSEMATSAIAQWHKPNGSSCAILLFIALSAQFRHLSRYSTTSCFLPK